MFSFFCYAIRDLIENFSNIQLNITSILTMFIDNYKENTYNSFKKELVKWQSQLKKEY